MRPIRYIVKVFSQSSQQWRISYESSLRQAIALTYELRTMFTVFDNQTNCFIAASSCMVFDSTKQWSHNRRAFKQSLKTVGV